MSAMRALAARSGRTGCATPGGFPSILPRDGSSSPTWGKMRGKRSTSSGLSVSSFGEDEDGELFVVDYRGAIYRFVNR